MKKANVPSSRTATTIGMKKNGEYIDSENQITEVYAITRKEWNVQFR